MAAKITSISPLTTPEGPLAHWDYSWKNLYLDIGIDHDTVCAGVVGTAIRHSTSCAGHRAAACASTSWHNECCAGLQYQPLQRRPYKWSTSILPRSQFYKKQGKLAFRRLVPLFVPIGICVTTHDDGTASDVTIDMWHHNQQATNHEHNGKPWFSLPKSLSHVICKWWYAVEWMIIQKYAQVMPWI